MGKCFQIAHLFHLQIFITVTSFNAVIFKDRNRVISFYFVVAFNLNKGASTSIAASSKTR